LPETLPVENPEVTGKDSVAVSRIDENDHQNTFLPGRMEKRKNNIIIQGRREIKFRKFNRRSLWQLDTSITSPGSNLRR
jgi:hypothetical protein